MHTNHNLGDDKSSIKGELLVESGPVLVGVNELGEGRPLLCRQLYPALLLVMPIEKGVESGMWHV